MVGDRSNKKRTREEPKLMDVMTRAIALYLELVTASPGADSEREKRGRLSIFR